MAATLLGLPSATGAYGQAGAEQRDAGASFVAALNDAIDRASVKGVTAAEDLCGDVSAWAFDIDAMSGSVAGQLWQSMADTDKAVFRQRFARKIARDCARRGERALGSRVELVGARRLTDGEWMLGTRSQASAVSATQVMWRGRVDADGSFRVTDVLIDGRSAVQSARADAAEALKSAGGDAAALMAWAER